MTSAEIRQSFLDFFHDDVRQHTVVPSSSLLPDSPGLLFTNAGMNQFVPIFLGDRQPDVSKWAGVRPASDRRATDTQKCIRAGGKHNDLEDVGFDTYHHTMFEMLGNWSFGDYFKKESLTWGWELLTKVWGIPAKRLFVTVYCPADAQPHWENTISHICTQAKSKSVTKWGATDRQDLFNSPDSVFKKLGLKENPDLEAAYWWAELFYAEGLDPLVHIVPGNKKDNFWMMGDTGPCGPCSEIHFNLLPSDDEAAGRKLVNAGSPRCIEIWNHVFIQFNANADGTLPQLAAKHVDTGMGFERVAGIYATTDGFRNFDKDPSNYAADVFAPLFKKVTELSGKTYQGTVPKSREGLSEQENTDIAFRVLADHSRCIACAIADGILPGNDGRNYVVRRILRRGILYGKKLGLATGFFEQLVAPVVESLGDVFPELKQQQDLVRRVIRAEEENFGRTLERGLELFSAPHPLEQFLLGEPYDPEVRARKKYMHGAEMLDAWRNTYPQYLKSILDAVRNSGAATEEGIRRIRDRVGDVSFGAMLESLRDIEANSALFSSFLQHLRSTVSGQKAFELYDTYGFPLDMTQLLAAERGLTVDTVEFERLMGEQRERGRAALKKEVVVAATEGEATITQQPTKFLGYTQLVAEAKVIDVVKTKKDTYLVFDQTPFYAEMGGQAGDHGAVKILGQTFAILYTIKDKAGRFLHQLAPACALDIAKLNVVGQPATLAVSPMARRAISRHHTAEHLIHWALRKTLGTHVRQAGTSKTKERMRFDFTHFEQVKPEQLREVERLVNDKILDNAKVETYETEFDKKPEGTLAFFGEKYGKIVRVVDIGGYSRELCGGTHVSTTGEIGLVKIVAEMAIAAGTRRLEVVAGQAAYDLVEDEENALKTVSAKLNTGLQDVAHKLDTLLAQKAELEKKLKGFEQKASAGLADDLAAKATVRDGLKFVSAVVTADTPEALRGLGSQVLAKLGDGVVVLGAALGEKAMVIALCSPAAVKAGHQAGKIVNELSVKLGGKGGGKPDFAMGGGRDVAKLAEVLKG